MAWPEEDVRSFLENNCKLNRNNKLQGAYFTHHVEVFHFLRSLQEKSNFELTFNIDHVDAHADLGTGDCSYVYIASDILSLPIHERAYPQKINGCYGLSSGNFLAFAVACRWISCLRYINDINETDDIQWFNLKNFEFFADSIQLKQFSSADMEALTSGRLGDMQLGARSLTPISIEPEVPLHVIDHKSFSSTNTYDFIFLTQSPGFTPKTSDVLIPVIKEYMIIK